MGDTSPKTQKKRSRAKRNECQSDQFLRQRTTKCSLNVIVKTDHPEFFSFLEKTVLLVNQLETLGSWIIKHHLFSILQTEGSISFPINQTYVWKAFRMMYSDIAERKEFEYSLDSSVAFVKQTVNPSIPNVGISSTLLNQILMFSARTWLTNLKVHLQTHLGTALKHWTKNQIRAVMSPSDFSQQAKHFKTYFDRLESFSFYSRYLDFKTKVEEVEKLLEQNKMFNEDENSKEAKIPVPQEKCLQWLWEMRRDSELLEINTGRKMKSISVLPQCQMKMGNIHFDTTIVCLLFRKFFPANKTPVAQLAKCGNESTTWGALFDLEKIQHLRPGWKFQWSLNTNGVTASMLFGKQFPKSKGFEEPPKKKRKTQKTPDSKNKPILTELPTRFHYEQVILETYRHWDPGVQFISVDPGVHNVLTCWSVGQNKCPFRLGQKQYCHESGLTLHRKQSNRLRADYAATIQPHLTEVPHVRSVMLDRIEAHLQVLRIYWDQIWQIESQRKIRRVKFSQWIRQQKFTDKVLARFEKVCETQHAKKTIVLFGQGGTRGFGFVRGGGVKGPVVKLRRLLSKRVPVIGVNEFRTSKCCLKCGKVLKHPQKGQMTAVSYCSETDHHCMLDRDVDAAQKIGYRFLCQLETGLSDAKTLGSWSYDVKGDTLDESKSPSPLHQFMTNHFPRDYGSHRVGSRRKRFSAKKQKRYSKSASDISLKKNLMDGVADCIENNKHDA